MTPPAALRTLPELLEWRASRSPAGLAYREYDRASDSWRSWSWQEVRESVEQVTIALAGLALPAGTRVGILLPNGVDAACIDLAVLASGCVPVPLHALDNPESIAWILADSGAAVLFAATDGDWRRIAALAHPLPALRHVVARTIEGRVVPGEVPDVRSLASWTAAAPLLAARMPARALLEGDLAALVYTSGTTGRPKGVMLTHSNVMSNVRACLERFSPREDDMFLSFLPLSHTFERTAGFYLPIAAGSCVTFVRSVQQLAEDLRTVRPTVLVSVPRIYEKIHSGLQAAAGATLAGGLDPLSMAIAAGWRRFERRQGRRRQRTPGAAIDTLLHAVLDPFVGRRLRAQFGGRLRIAVSGGAPLAPAIARCFLGLGVDVVQGYGMTETSPVVACNSLLDNDPDTVGRPLPDVEVRLGDQRELQVRGPNVMAGYWNRPEDTAAAFVDGWLRTGDQAAIVDGRLRIVGRLKDILVTATGEKIAPADVEQALLGDPLFEQAFVFGEGRPFLGCVLVLADRGWRDLAVRVGLDPDDPAALSAPGAVGAVMRHVQRQTSALPRHGQPRRILLTRDAWTMANGLLTPTLKPKRNNLTARFASAIEALYESSGPRPG